MVAEPAGAPGHRRRVADDGVRYVRGRAAEGDERDRLWARWVEFSDQYDGWAALRSGKTAIVVLEPRTGAEVTA